MIFMSITRALMASVAMFPTVFKTYEKHYRRSKEILILKFVIDTIN